MRGLGFFMVIAALPALAALGHDFYLFYQDHGVDNFWQDLNRVIEEKGFWSLFASLGFTWTRYAPESYAWVVENTGEKTWSVINEVLVYKTVVIGAVLAGFFYGAWALVKLAGTLARKGPASFAGARRVDGLPGRKAAGNFKYKRKF